MYITRTQNMTLAGLAFVAALVAQQAQAFGIPGPVVPDALSTVQYPGDFVGGHVSGAQVGKQ